MSVRITAHRSSLRQFLFGLSGLLLLVAAIDIVWAHRATLEPERGDNGQLTRRGEARHRQDVIVGTAFLLTGGALVVVAIGGLAMPRTVARVDDEGIRLRIKSPRTSITFPWHEIADVRSGREPGDGIAMRPVLLVALKEPDRWPTEFWGALRSGPWLIVDATSWDTPPEELAVHAWLALSAASQDVTGTVEGPDSSPA